jgi:hypothetical protein
LSHVALVIPGVDRIGGAERQVILLAKGTAPARLEGQRGSALRHWRRCGGGIDRRGSWLPDPGDAQRPGRPARMDSPQSLASSRVSGGASRSSAPCRMDCALVAAGCASPCGDRHASQLLDRHPGPEVGLSMERLACGSGHCCKCRRGCAPVLLDGRAEQAYCPAQRSGWEASGGPMLRPGKRCAWSLDSIRNFSGSPQAG